jgi:hypothetical protein
MKQAKRRATVRRHEEARQLELGIAQLERVTAELRRRTAEAVASREADA